MFRAPPAVPRVILRVRRGRSAARRRLRMAASAEVDGDRIWSPAAPLSRVRDTRERDRFRSPIVLTYVDGVTRGGSWFPSRRARRPTDLCCAVGVFLMWPRPDALWHPLCVSSSLTGRPLLVKGKPAARRGRKTTGQAPGLIAGLPKEGWQSPPGSMVVSPNGGDDHVFENASRRRLHRGRPSPRRSPLGRSPDRSGGPRCLLDCSDHEYRRKLVDGSGLL